MHITRTSLRLVFGLAVVGAAATLGTVALLEGIRPPSRLLSLTSRLSDVGQEGLVPPVPARDLSPLGRGAYLLDGPTLVGVGLDSASAEQARRAAGQEGFHWLPRTVGGVHVYDPSNRLELRLPKNDFPRGYVLLAPGQMPVMRAGPLDLQDLRRQLASYRSSWMGRQAPS
jgi:hypothetical protein